MTIINNLNAPFVMPTNVGTNGQFVKSNGDGTSSWGNGSSGTVTSVSASDGLTTDTGTPITTSGNIKLANIAASTVLSNITGGSALPIANSMSSILDSSFSNTQGAVLYRNASAWVALAPGTSGQFLQTGGAAANPSWQNAGSGTVNPGTANYLAYYAATGSAVSGLATANNGTLITSGAGVPSISSTLPSAVQANITAVGALTSGSLSTGFTTVAIAQGGTGVTSVTTAPTASSFAGWDANSNLSANAVIPGYATTATAGGTTTLTVASKQTQFFTGTLAQTVVMPVTSTLVLGQYFVISNASTVSPITVNSSGGDLIVSVAPGTSATVICVLTSGTTAASWFSPTVGSSATNQSSIALSPTVFTYFNQITTGSALWISSTAPNTQGAFSGSAAADYGTFTFKAAAGTYNCAILFPQGTGNGIMRLIFNGGTPTDIDQYGTSVNQYVSYQFSVTLVEGDNTIQCITNGKNGSSSNYFLTFADNIILNRTGP